MIDSIIGSFITIHNRMRGQDIPSSKPWYYIIFTVLAFIMVDFDWKLTLLWTLFSFSYATVGWHAMFSAVHGNQPGRRDAWYYDWLQDVAQWFENQFDKYLWWSTNWFRFGIVYGAMRGAFVIPALWLISNYTGNWDTFWWGSAWFLNLGMVYFAWGRIIGPGFAVFMSELTVGAAIAILMANCV